MENGTLKAPSRYIMIGGFLGAGKTTAIQQYAKALDARGLKVGLITNDQGAGLVDSALGRSHRFPVEEIAGGCFCCRFGSLVEAARTLTDAEKPDVFLAEPVGSCTDLVATVSLPLQKIYGEHYRVAPLSVLVDPVRALRVLGLEDGKKFSENVRYIYRKQLEEAEIIVINKTDILTTERLNHLHSGLKNAFPDAKVFEISARNGMGLDPWFAAMENAELNIGRFLEIDYGRYGEGEALLGWLNATVKLESDGDEFDGNSLIQTLASTLRESFEKAGSEIAHLKMTLTPFGDPYEIAAVNLVRDGVSPELSHRLSEPLDDGELLVNIRAEADPDTIHTAARAAVESVIGAIPGLRFEITHEEHFRPGQPVPTHRMTEA